MSYTLGGGFWVVMDVYVVIVVGVVRVVRVVGVVRVVMDLTCHNDSRSSAFSEDNYYHIQYSNLITFS